MIFLEEIETGCEIIVEETEQEENIDTPDQPEEDHQQAGQGHDESQHLPHELDLPPHVEIVDWERIFGEQRKIIEKEERLRKEKIEKAKTLEKSREVLRVCKSKQRLESHQGEQATRKEKRG